MTRRVLTALLGGGAVFFLLGMTWAWPLTLICIIVGVLGCREIARLVGATWARATVSGVLWSLACVVGGLLGGDAGAFGMACVTTVLGAWAWTRATPSVAGLVAPVAGALVSLVWMHRHIEGEAKWFPNLAMLLVLPIWAGDTAGLIFGKTLGRTPLAPSISPKKTWEGALLNFASCVAVAWALGMWLRVPWSASLALGVTGGLLGQVGDLMESALKRRAGVKDSGSVLPGHGGIMDRMDSMMLAMAPMALILWLLADQLQGR